MGKILLAVVMVVCFAMVGCKKETVVSTDASFKNATTVVLKTITTKTAKTVKK